jgi:hypothetical protein
VAARSQVHGSNTVECGAHCNPSEADAGLVAWFPKLSEKLAGVHLSAVWPWRHLHSQAGTTRHNHSPVRGQLERFLGYLAL